MPAVEVSGEPGAARPPSRRYPSFRVALIPIVALIFFLSLNIFIYHSEAVYGPNQMAIFLASAVAMAIGVFYLKVPFEQIEHNITRSISVSLQAMLILLVVGALIGTWILSGIVPTMVFYGLKLLSPQIFLPVACFVAAIVSMATGNSWSTTGTVGVAFMGVGTAMNLPVGLVAGAILSGAYFGDKMSPLSDTTNLAASVVGVDLMQHIRHMLYSTMPAFILSMIVFTIIGFSYHSTLSSFDSINQLLFSIDRSFNVAPFLFVIPLFVFWMVAKKVPALLALIIGTVLGIVAALIFQKKVLLTGRPLEVDETIWIYRQILEATYHGTHFHTGHAVIDNLFSRGGMEEMLNTVWIVFSSMVFSGTMEETKMLEVIAHRILRSVTSIPGLIGSTLATCTFVNITASEQYLSVVIPGKMFKEAYARFGLDPKNLSRALEDAGSVTSCLVPWNSCGAYHSSVLGVATMTYFPYCFFSFFGPFFSMVLACTGWTIVRLPDNQQQEQNEQVMPLISPSDILEEKEQRSLSPHHRQVAAWPPL